MAVGRALVLRPARPRRPRAVAATCGSTARRPSRPRPCDRATGSTPASHGRDRLVEVVRIIDKRVSAPLAAECLVDSSPPPPAKDETPPVFDRDRGAGRPTKRDRRDLDRLRGGTAF